MAKIKVAFIRELINQVDKGKISFSRMVEMINEEAKREITAKEAGMFAREECVYQYCPTPDLCKEKCACGY